MDVPFTNRELEHMFEEIKSSMARIETQTVKTNGRVTRLEKIVFIGTTALVMLIVLKFPELLAVLKFL